MRLLDAQLALAPKARAYTSPSLPQEEHKTRPTSSNDINRDSFSRLSTNEHRCESEHDSAGLEQEANDDEPSIGVEQVPLRQSSRRTVNYKSDSEQDNSKAGDSTTPGQARLLADGTPVPKMPPMPLLTQVKSKKARARRNRSPVLSFDGAVAEEELKISQWQVLPDDPRRISSLGPKVKRNAPAPWELGGEEDLMTPDRRLPSTESFDKPFARLKQRPSVDHTSSYSAVPNLPFALSAKHAPKARSNDREAEKENDVQSLFASQRSRSKSVSNSAVGMLKGLGLAAAVSAPASTKAKLSKALRYVGAGGDEAKISAPLKTLSPNSNMDTSRSPAPTFTFDDNSALSSSPSSRTITSIAPTQNISDLVDLVASANTKYADQACSPPLPPSRSSRFTSSTQNEDTHSMASVRPSLLSNTSSDEYSLHQSSSKDSSVSRATTRPSESDDHGVFDPADAQKKADTTVTSSPIQGGMSLSPSSQGSSQLPFPLPGNIEGVQYRLISLEQAREQARLRQSEWLATVGSSTAMQNPISPTSSETRFDDAIGFKDGSTDHILSSSGKLMRNKRSGFLRKLKKDKDRGDDIDTVSTDFSNVSSKDTDYHKQTQMPSFSVTGLDEEPPTRFVSDTASPALSIRPVSSMFSGFTAEFLDASAISQTHLREASNGSASSVSGLLMPHSPASSSRLSPDMSRSPSVSTLEGGRFHDSGTTAPLFYRSKSAETTTSSHGSSVGFASSADSPAARQLPGNPVSSVSDSQPSACLMPTSRPSYDHTVAQATANDDTAMPGSSATAIPSIPEEVAERARELEEQIRTLSEELRGLRIQHIGHGTAPNHALSADHTQADRQVGSCPSCGCGCAEQRRMQSINEAAVLTGASILDRGRALKSAKNTVVTGRFGGYSS